MTLLLAADDDFALKVALFMIVGLGMVISAWYVARRERRRSEALRAVAASLDLRFFPKKDHDHDSRYEHFAVFRQGRDRYAHNTMVGLRTIHGHACSVLLGDYHYEIERGSGKSRRTTSYRFSYAIVNLPFPTAGEVIVRPEGVLDRLAAAAGFADINFESAEFSRSFHVKSKDRRFAYDLIDARMMEFLLRTRPPLVEIERGRILVTDGKRRWDGPGFARHLRWVENFLDHWPRHLVEQLQPSP